MEVIKMIETKDPDIEFLCQGDTRLFHQLRHRLVQRDGITVGTVECSMVDVRVETAELGTRTLAIDIGPIPDHTPQGGKCSRAQILIGEICEVLRVEEVFTSSKHVMKWHFLGKKVSHLFYDP
ncbi:hypothetical protein ASD72_05785 [Pseudoxanthomonas sp. Root630]|nr:hypothetical protein ASD72_05785 [Pseudoxanthomonas sp. Root630]